MPGILAVIVPRHRQHFVASGEWLLCLVQLPDDVGHDPRQQKEAYLRTPDGFALAHRSGIRRYILGQPLSGPNVLNVTVIVGHRFAGWTGAAAGVAGFLGWPCLVVVGMGVLYQFYGALPQVQQALAGMSSVAAGLLFATVVKLATVLPRNWRPWLFGALAFAGVGVMRWPLLWVMGVLAPWAIFVAWRERE